MCKATRHCYIGPGAEVGLRTRRIGTVRGREIEGCETHQHARRKEPIEKPRWKIVYYRSPAYVGLHRTDFQSPGTAEW